MKVALLISGQTRFLKECSDLIKAHIVDRYNADVFIHTWSSWKYKYAPRGKKPKTITGVATVEELKEVYPVTDCIIEDQIDQYESPNWNTWKFKGKVQRNHPHLFSPCSMFYSTYRANELKKKHEESHGKYDVVVKARFDLIVPVVVPLDLVQQGDLQMWHGATFFGPVSDQFAFGNSESMDAYSRMYKYIWEAMDAHNNGKPGFNTVCGLHPETALFNHLRKSGIAMSTMPKWGKLRLKRP